MMSSLPGTLYVEGLCRREVLDGMVLLDGNGRRPDVVGDVSISSPRRCQDKCNSPDTRERRGAMHEWETRDTQLLGDS